MLHDRGFASSISVHAFCPTMDLVAVATADGALHVHRSTSKKFQRLFSVNDPDLREISTLAWGPGGKVLAVGLANGSVSLFDVETGAPQPMPSSHTPHNDAVVTLCWTRQLGEGEVRTSTERRGGGGDGGGSSARAVDDLYVALEDRLNRFLAFPSPLREASSMSHLGDAAVQHRWYTASKVTQGTAALDILVSGDDSGVVTLSALGFFPVGCVDLSEAVDLSQYQRPRVCHVCLSADLQTLSVVLEARPHSKSHGAHASHNSLTGASAGGEGGAGGGAGDARGEEGESSSSSSSSSSSISHSSNVQYNLVAVDTSLLWDRRHELLQIATQCGHVGDLLSHVMETVVAMESNWSEAIGSLKTQLDTLQQLLNNHGRTTTSQQELFMLLTTGTPSAAAQQFFTQKLSDQGVGRLQKMLDTACSDLERLLVDHVQQSTQHIIFRIGELTGLAKWEQRFGDVGLREEVLDALMLGAQTLMIKTEDMLGDVREARINLNALFVWLLRVVHRVAGENRAAGPRALATVDVQRVASLLQPSRTSGTGGDSDAGGVGGGGGGGGGGGSAQHQQQQQQQQQQQKQKQQQHRQWRHDQRHPWADLAGPPCVVAGPRNALLQSHISDYFLNQAQASDSQDVCGQPGLASMFPSLPLPGHCASAQRAAASVSLRQTFDGLCDLWQKAFHEPSAEVSASFRPMSNIPVFDIYDEGNDKACIGEPSGTAPPPR